MAVLPPPPVQDSPGSYAWLDWYRKLRDYISQTGSVPWAVIDFAGSNITSIASRSHQNLQSLQGGTTGEYYHLTSSEYTGTGSGVFVRKDTPKFSNNIILPKTSGVGIKVDETTPTFSWGTVANIAMVRGSGATDPNLVTYRNNIKQYQYAVNDESWFEVHIPHDYVPGTDLYMEVHWSLATGGISETVTWSVEAIYSKSFNQAAFPASVTMSTSTASSTTQYQLINTEVQLTGSGKLTLADIEPGGIIIGRIYLSANTGATDPFLHLANINYQTTVVGTKNRSYPFYT